MFTHGSNGAADVLWGAGAIKSKLYSGGNEAELQFPAGADRDGVKAEINNLSLSDYKKSGGGTSGCAFF